MNIIVCIKQVPDTNEVKLDPVTGDQQELAYTRQGITSFARNGRHTLTLLADGSAAFYDENGLLLDELAMMCTFGDVAGEFALIGNRDVPSLRLLRLKTHPEDFSLSKCFPAWSRRSAQAGAFGRATGHPPMRRHFEDSRT